MKRLIVSLSVLSGIAMAQSTPLQYLLTFQLASGLDASKMTPQQMGVFMEHAKYLNALRKKGVLLAGHTNETVNTMGFIVFQGDEASARAVVADDPVVKAQLVTTAIRPFNLIMPQAPPAALVSDSKANYDAVVKFLAGAAKKMPEDQYSFRPADSVRTFGQLVGHVAETQYMICSLVRGEEYKPHNIEQTVTGKAPLVAAVEKSSTFCQETWTQLAPDALVERVKLFGNERTKLGAMDLATAHAFEHYGNMVTYLRMKGIVPASSE